MYAKNREHIYNQQFNLEQTRFATENIQTTKEMVSAMKSAKQELQVGSTLDYETYSKTCLFESNAITSDWHEGDKLG